MADQYDGFDYEEAAKTSNAAIQAQVKRNQQALDAENVSTANAVETIRQVDEEKRKASGLNDTGLREDAPSGATREPTTGKGMYHLITPSLGYVLEDMLEESRNLGLNQPDADTCLMQAIVYAYKWLATEQMFYLDMAIEQVVFSCGYDSERPSSFANALMRLAKHYENGAIKYNFSKDFENIPEVLEWLKSSAKIVEKLSLSMLEIDVEAVMKNGLEQTIQNTLKDKGTIPKNGMNFILMLDTTIQNYDKKIQNLKQEINLQNKEILLNKEDLQKKVMNLFGSLKIIDALFVDENLMKWQLPILTMTTQQDGQEDYYVVGATTDWDSLKMILTYCQKQLNIWNNPPLQLSLKNGKINCFKTGARNWEKGLSCSRCFDSGIRHMVRYIDGDRSEDHLAAAIWNLVGIRHYLMFKYYEGVEGVLDLDMPWRGTQQKVREEEL